MQAVPLQVEKFRSPRQELGGQAVGAVLRPLQLLMQATGLLFLATLTAMLLRHPDVPFYAIDHVAFGLLVFGVIGRAAVRQQPLFRVERATWPMLGLTALAVGSALEHGLLGLALYAWLMWELWRLGRGPIPLDERNGFLSRQFHSLWPLLLGVYWINAAFVVMNYQFVNGLLFTMAGMLAAQQRRWSNQSSPQFREFEI